MTKVMGQVPTAWVVTDVRAHRMRKQPLGLLLMAALLCLMAVAEVLFLNSVAGPDSVASMMAAEGMATED